MQGNRMSSEKDFIPSDIARDTLKRLAQLRIPPTPDNFHKIYNQIAGKPNSQISETYEKIMIELAKEFPRHTQQLLDCANNLKKAAHEKNWFKYKSTLVKFVTADNTEPSSNKAVTISDLQPDFGVTPFREEHDLGNFTEQHVELISKFLELSVLFLNEDAYFEAIKLAQQARKIQSRHDMNQFMDCLKQFYTKLESYKENHVTLQQDLLRLFNLLIRSIEQLFSEDRWINAQIAKVKDIMSEPLSKESIALTEHYLEEIFQVKKYERNRLAEASAIMKLTVASLVTNLEELFDETGAYQGKLEYFSGKIKKCNDVEGLSQLIDEVVHETRQAQKHLLDYRNILQKSRVEAVRAQHQINRMETKLQELNEAAHKDCLTGALNRRGFNAAYERAMSLTTRNQRPLCFALIDIDNFKLLNDTYGHDAGDNVLVYLVEAVKEMIRLEDIVSRYGGEEFAILLPETKLEDAAQVIMKVRRHLTKKFFLHENKRILITFSAGIAQYQAGDTQLSLYQRADKALYCAKKNGKNQVVLETQEQGDV